MITNSFSEIGGYFELEVEQRFDNIKNQIALNCVRNCLRYIIRAFNIKEICVPYYTCPVVWQAIKKEECKMKFYHIDKNFMPIVDIHENDYILYTNYFGICAKNVKKLAKKFKNLIVDNSQAFYMPKYGIASRAMDLLFEYAKNSLNIAYIILTVHPKNNSAIKLYEKKRFKIIGIKQDNNFSIMKKEL